MQRATSIEFCTFQSKYKKPVSHEQTSDSEVPQKSKKRRNQQPNTSTYRSFRRKAKTPCMSSASNTSTRVADKSDSSSDYDDDDDDMLNNFRHSRSANIPSTSSSSRAPAVLDVNVPSTSTGITANGKGYHLFRIANNATIDSDDDQSIPDASHPSDTNTLRIIRSPPIHNNNHNNHHHHDYTTTATSSSAAAAGASTQRNNYSSNRTDFPVNGHNKKLLCTQEQEDDDDDDSSSSSKYIEDYASTDSNSSLSSTSDSSNGSSCVDFYAKKRKLNTGRERQRVV